MFYHDFRGARSKWLGYNIHGAFAKITKLTWTQPCSRTGLRQNRLTWTSLLPELLTIKIGNLYIYRTQVNLGSDLSKYATNAIGAMLLLNLIQVTESIYGSVVPLAMFFNHLRPLVSPSSWTNIHLFWPNISTCFVFVKAPLALSLPMYSSRLIW